MLSAKKVLLISITIVALVLSALFASAQPRVPQDSVWGPWNVFIGDWSAENNGQGSTASATFTLKPDLNNNVLIRRIRMEMPDTGFKKPSVHEAMLVIPRTPKVGVHKATYFDDEGRTRTYDVVYNAQTIVLTTASPASGSKDLVYRMTFMPVADDRVKVRIESAVASSPKSFKLVNEENWLRH